MWHSPSSDVSESPSSHWLFWHCRFKDCDKNMRVRTRTGEKLTCPWCKRAQDGPTALYRRLEELEAERERARKPKVAAEPVKSSTATKLTVNGGSQPTPKKRLRVVDQPAEPPAAAPEPMTVPPSPPPKSEPGFIDRVLFRV